MKQTSLCAALAAVLATKGEVPASATMQGVKVKLTVAQRAYNKLKEDAETYFEDDAQQSALANFVKLSVEVRTSADTIQKQIWEGVASVFPGTDAPSWHQIDVMKRSVGLHVSGTDYVYGQTIVGLRRLQSLGATYNDKGQLIDLGELPAKTGGKKKGKREKSAARHQTSVAKDLLALRTRLKEYKGVIDPAALKLYAEAFKLLGDALKLDRRAS